MIRMNFVQTSTLACVASLVIAAPLRAQQLQLRAEWGANVTEYRGQIGRRVTVVCPADGKVGNVYGTNTYTDDSSVCTAAVHAGVITLREGGVVTMVVGPGLRAYEASTKNGIESRRFGPWQGSFSFDTTGTVGRIDWTTMPVGLELARTPLTVECPPAAGTRVGRVWGSDLYTSDSSICAAAAHAGVIDASVGGRVSVAAAGPQPSFVAATRNGVSSSTFGAWPNSFRVTPATSAAAAAPVVGQASALQPEVAVVTRPLLGTHTITTPALAIAGVYPRATHAIVTAQLVVSGIYPRSTHSIVTAPLVAAGIYPKASHTITTLPLTVTGLFPPARTTTTRVAPTARPTRPTPTP